MEKKPLSYEGLPLKDNEQLNYCPTNPTQSIVSSNPYAAQLFQRFLNNIKKKYPRLEFIEMAVMWSLFQLNIRPDASSVRSGLQFIYQIDGENFYWNFKARNRKEPQSIFLYALTQLLKRHQSQYTLRELARILDSGLPPTIPIGPTFSNFLTQNSSELKNFESFKKVYFKATQVLNSRESIPKLLFERLVKSHPIRDQKENYQKVDHMFKSKSNPSLRCSFDINAYEHSIFIVSPEKVGRHNSFGLSEGLQNTFLATSHYRPVFKPYRNSYLFEGHPVGHQSALCSYKTKNREIHLLSGQGRDPGQFIYQFFQNNLELIKETKNIDQISRDARLLKLYSPDRILVESHRAREDLLEALHLQNKPIYHASQLGELTFWLRTQSSHGFVTDSRTSTIPLCQN